MTNSVVHRCCIVSGETGVVWYSAAHNLLLHSKSLRKSL